MKKTVFILFIFFIIAIPNMVMASTYSITEYDIDMKVNENNTFDIIENISAKFNIAQHGIFRKLPVKNKVERADGTKSSNIAVISNIKTNVMSTISKDYKYETIKLGDPNKTVIGNQNYKISYTYDIGKDPLKDKDELYFNIIGTEWDTSIDNVRFNITMPKEFDSSTLGISAGKYGSMNSSNVYYDVNGNTIEGDYAGRLLPGEGITVRLTLPEGYFVNTHTNIDKLSLIYAVSVILLGSIFVIIAFALWSKFGKDEEVVETVEFYPPKGYNSAEIGYLYKGGDNEQGVISLLIYLADKGYLKIKEDEEDFVIKKVKDYDGDNENERLFFEGLFKKEDEVTKYDLRNKFYKTVGKISQNLREMKDKIFEKSGTSKIKYVVIMIIVLVVLTLLFPVIMVGENENVIFIIGFLPIIALPLMYIPIKLIVSGLRNKEGKIVKIIGGTLFLILILVLMKNEIINGTELQNLMVEEPLDMVTFFIGVACVIALIVFANIMPKRTQFGREMLGKIKGFKNFLETTEKEQLEKLVEQNPEYFYNILPYTYALGVSEVWMKQFEDIALKDPDWYDSYSTYSRSNLYSFMNISMRGIQSSMCSTPASSGGSGGGGSSGGGFSGGGSGGGGGGSW